MGSEGIVCWPFPSINHLDMQALALIFCTCNKVVLFSISTFRILPSTLLTPNTYFEPQSFPRSGCEQLLEMGNQRSVRFGARIPEHTMARQPGHGNMAGVDVEPICNDRAVRLYWDFSFDAVDKDFQRSGCVFCVIEIGVSIHIAVDDAALERCIAGVVVVIAS